ncbi:hypothetical protein [Actinomadura litoris]|uniref:hypothetical protein n=1 Tax=Actinomadura litoris TaxID=2678616 RepID=UPI001FA757EE|nr:hypothetical protein [Actinomadura litoris]
MADENLLTISFPPADVDEAVERHKRLTAAAEDLGGAGGTWKVSEGWFSVHARTQAGRDRLQAEAVPLPSGWAMRIGAGPV